MKSLQNNPPTFCQEQYQRADDKLFHFQVPVTKHYLSLWELHSPQIEKTWMDGERLQESPVDLNNSRPQRQFIQEGHKSQELHVKNCKPHLIKLSSEVMF